MVMGLIRGSPNLGGPIVTASGLVFIAAATDDKLRAFNAATGKELWQAPLPAGGQATPMTYVAGGRQFVVIAAGGNYRMGTRIGDAVVSPIRQESPFFRKIPAALSTMSCRLTRCRPRCSTTSATERGVMASRVPDGVRDDAQCCRAGWGAASANIGPAL